MRDGNVKEIASTGETVQGEFKKEVTFEDETAENFETEVPTFANEESCRRCSRSTTWWSTPSRPASRSLLATILF